MKNVLHKFANWKTTVFGSLFALTSFIAANPEYIYELFPKEECGDFAWQIIRASRVFMLVFGIVMASVMKDRNVTGGTVANTIPKPGKKGKATLPLLLILLAIIPFLFLGGCASLTAYSVERQVDPDGLIKPVAVKRVQLYSDVVGSVTIKRDGTVVVGDPSATAPMKRVPVLSPDKSQVLGYEETPIVASVNNSAPTNTVFSGVGTIFSGLFSTLRTVAGFMFGGALFSATPTDTATP